MTLQVLVTRPEPSNTRTATALRARGYQTLVMPLTRTVPLAKDQELMRSTQAGAYVVTSAAAIRYWKELDPQPGQLSAPLYAVGERTGEQARSSGFGDVRVGPGDADALAGVLVSDIEAGHLVVSESEPVIHVTGRVRKSDIETLMQRQKIPHRIAEIYDTEKLSYSTDYLPRRLAKDDPIAALLYSYHGANLLVQHLIRTHSDRILKNCTFLCLSASVATAIPDGFRSQVRIASAPSEAELLEQLDRLANAS